MTIYDRKSKESGKLTYTISNVTTTGNTTSANFISQMVDEKGKILSEGAGKFKCNAGVLYIDAKVAIPQESMAAYKDMDVKADEVFIDYPATPAVGQRLNNVSYKMEMYNKGSLFSTITLAQSNRKIESKETVTSGMGSWECYKITYDSQFKATIGGIGIPINMKVTEWFAPGFGVVKSEIYNKNGKFLGATQITSIGK